MSNDVLDRPGLTEAAAARAGLGPEAAALLRSAMTPLQYLDALRSAGRFLEAVRFMSWALPRREAVWWACQCVRRVHRPDDPKPALAAVEAAERWAAAPTDENRRAAFTAAEAADFGTPAGCAAAAAFWSGGSMAPPTLAAVPPAEHLMPAAVVNAVQLATVHGEPVKAEEKYRLFLALSVEVAAGKNRWKEDPAATPGTRPIPPRRS
jgi:hypothetical protein